MWAEAAKWLGKFDETVLTGLDVDGYPVSIRVDPRNYGHDGHAACGVSLYPARHRGSGQFVVPHSRRKDVAPEHDPSQGSPRESQRRMGVPEH